MGGNSKPWWLICARCGIRDKIGKESAARYESFMHNRNRHKGQEFAFAEQSS